MLLSHAVLLVRPGRLSPGIASLLPIAFLPAATAQHPPGVTARTPLSAYFQGCASLWLPYHFHSPFSLMIEVSCNIAFPNQPLTNPAR